MTRDQFAESNQSSQVTYGQEVMFRMEIFLDSRVLKHGEIPILFMYIYTLEVNHHLKNGGSFWMMINPYLKNGGSETNL